MDREGIGGVGDARAAERADVETASEEYAGRFAGPVGEWFVSLQSRITLRLMAGLPAGARVLDVGGGHAQIAPALAAAGYRTTVAGSAPAAAARLGDLIAAGSLTFDTVCFSRLPYADRSFDAAVCFRLLPHFAEWKELIAELCRVTRVRVVVDYPSIRSVNFASARLFGLKKRVEGNTRPFGLFHPSEIEAAFRSRGFRLSASVAQYFFPMALHRAHGSLLVARGIEAPARWIGLTQRLGSPVIARADRLEPG
ncbi:MAG: class I SAM-dependent methyltransferase [Candidatus Eisenbacteria bacterium]|nr:class I SAM-dependent methyltransferase [Candidatus Eisenbacteria bacterium]